MSDVAKYLVVALGGAVGAVARYALGGWVQAKWGDSFPYGTLAINVSGSFVLGLFATLFLGLAWSEHWRLLVAVGFLGAYTTFSTFSFESLQLLQAGRYRAAAFNLAGSVVLGLAAAFVGVLVGRVLLSTRT
jgi:fluoride exporter